MAIQDLTASLDLKQNLNIYITCKQFDNLNLILNIFDNSVQANLTGYNVRLRAMKSDQVPLIQEHTGITINSNIVNIEADEQLTTTAGDTPIELQFIDSTGNKKATFNLVLKVVPSVIAVSASVSTATYTLLEELENKLDQASDFFENIDQAIELNDELTTQNTNATSNISSLNTQNANATQNISSLETQNNSASTNIPSLTSLNTQAEANIEAMESFGDVTILAQTVASHTTQFKHIAIDVKNYGAKGDGITDDTNAFKNALLELASGGTLLIPNGTYLIQDILYVPSNTKILGVGQATLKRNSGINALMITKVNGSTGGYDACSNVSIENIIFDGSQSNFQSNCTLFASGHASNIKIHKCTFKNLDGWHMVELNSTKDSIVSECIFDNYGYGNNGATATEMLQLDFMSGTDAFPWFGPYDNTQCKNITIEKNVFRNSKNKAIGNHTFLSNIMLNNIKIINNVFDTINAYAISLNDIDGFSVLNNKFINCPYAVTLANQQNANKNILIQGNNYVGTRLDSYVAGEGRFVSINQDGRNGFTTSNVKILGNTILNANTNAIGLTASEVLISENHITGSYRNGIYFFGGDIGIISNNIIKNNVVGAESGRADIVIGNSGDASTLVTVTGNRVGTAIMGANISNVFVQGNNITTITPGTAIVKNNVINGTFTA